MSYARKFTDQDALALSLIKHCGFVGVAADGTPFLAPGYRVHRKRVRRLIELGALLPKFDGLGGGRSQTYVPADRRGGVMSKWQDPALQERLADASASGLSAGDIARLIGETRAAVDCAMRRYGLYADSRRRQGQNRQQVK